MFNESEFEIMKKKVYIQPIVEQSDALYSSSVLMVSGAPGLGIGGGGSTIPPGGGGD